MKIKKLLHAVLAVTMLFSACAFVGCGKKKGNSGNDNELNIIDDNYRNWYEVFVRSYYDSNNDGIGDLKGLEQKLDYISEMGFNGIWLMPVCQSQTYHKYDVVDYYTIDKEYGTNDDFKSMINAAHEKGINVICEKPISLKEEDVERVYSTAKKMNVKFMVAQVLRFWPEYELLKELYDSKKYGKLLSGYMCRLGACPKWSWDNWMKDPNRSGLVPYDLHVHDLDFMV